MACLARLKGDTRFLEATFPRGGRGRVQIVDATVDELTCRFQHGPGPRDVISVTANYGVRSLDVFVAMSNKEA